MNFQKLILLSSGSRLCIFLIQFISNHLIEDHKADAFNPPKNSSSPIIDFLLHGFGNWDAKHFLFIAENGYIYEHSSAFFPLYPLTIRLLSKILNNFLLSGVILNHFFFTLSCVYLYKLTRIVFNRNEGIALATVIVYCLNPANIFFSACYSESLYSMLTLSGLFYLHSNNEFLSIIPFFLSCLTRSNGLINFGYLAYYNLKKFSTSEKNILRFIFLLVKLGLEFLCLSSAFVLYQFYIYQNFCKNTQQKISNELVSYARENNYKLLTDRPISEWCLTQIPFSYSHVQMKYWNVGFFNYWHWKQIPNFVLASPILCMSFKSVFEFFKSMNRKNFYNFFGLFDKQAKSSSFKGNIDLHPFAVHLCFLIVSAMFFMHIQVATRFICSSNPLIFWWTASIMSDKSNDLSLKFSKFNKQFRFIILYFIFYSLIGTFLFSNFLPFT